MLDNMSANAETSRLFIQQGGIELLLALYRLPRLPPTFGSSSAAHALTATFRTLTMQHAQPLSKHLSSVLNQQLDQALQSAKVGAPSSHLRSLSLPLDVSIHIQPVQLVFARPKQLFSLGILHWLVPLELCPFPR